LESSFRLRKRLSPALPYLCIGIVPVFSEEFLIDLKVPVIREAVSVLNRAEGPARRETTYTFEGLERHEDDRDYTVTLRRNGLLTASMQVPLFAPVRDANDQHAVIITALDLLLRRVVFKAKSVFEAANVSAPYVLGMALQVFARPLQGIFGGPDGFTYPGATLDPKQYKFPYMELDDLGDLDRTIRPLCDHVHQTFGRENSPNFNDDDEWTAHYP
jgi:hypothetical protein